MCLPARQIGKTTFRDVERPWSSILLRQLYLVGILIDPLKDPRMHLGILLLAPYQKQSGVTILFLIGKSVNPLITPFIDKSIKRPPPVRDATIVGVFYLL